MEYSKVEIYGLVDYIRGKLHDDKYQNLNLSNNVEQYHLGNRIGAALNRLKKYQDSSVPCNDKYDPRNLLKHWRLFDKEFNGTFTMVTKRSYGDLIKETLCFLEYIIFLPKVVAKKLESPAKTTDAKEMEERLTKVARSRDKVKEFPKFWKYVCRNNCLTKKALMKDECKVLIDAILNVTQNNR